MKDSYEYISFCTFVTKPNVGERLTWRPPVATNSQLLGQDNLQKLS